MIVDSCVWIEIFLDGSLASRCEEQLVEKDVLVPSLVLYEVYKKLKVKASEDLALQSIAFLGQYIACEMNREVALLAADLSLEFNLGMADSLILAHARHLKVPLFTLDNDFSGISGVTVLRK